MTTADYIANKLYNAGVRFVFGIPGGPSIPYLEAFKRAGIEFILTSNEASAGIMADVSARLTGIPGICHATFGPGATNIATGVGGAFLDRSPVIVFTSEIEDRMAGRTTQMNIDHQKLFGPLTKATFRLNAKNTGDVMNKAIRLCRQEYPGPVHIGLPADIAEMETAIFQDEMNEKEAVFYNNKTDDIIKLLRNSRRPLIAAGLTAKRLGIEPLLLNFLDKYKTPVVITPMAKGLLSEEHPSYSGVLFHALSDYLEDIYERCDLLIGIGYDPVEVNYESWMPDIPLVHFDTRIMDLPSGENCLQFTSNPESWFEILNNLNQGSIVTESQVIKGVRNEMLSVFNSFTGHFGPVAALDILHRELPPDSIITADVGSHLHLAGQSWETKGIGRFIISNGWSGMGFGLPAALAAQIINRDAVVACITGDGGFLMMAGEMITARRYNLPIIVIVFSDGELNLIKLKQSWKEIPPYGTILYHGDLFGAETFFGVRVLHAGSTDELIKAVNTALSMNEPVIINALIDPDDYKWLVVKR